MAAINKRRFWLGVLAGGAVWVVFSFLLGRVGAVEARYAAAMMAGQFLKVPRYPLFAVEWIVLLFLLTYILAWLYVSLRGVLGPGPGRSKWVPGAAVRERLPQRRERGCLRVQR